jgi:alcohol dehydrogenase class IV
MSRSAVSDTPAAGTAFQSPGVIVTGAGASQSVGEHVARLGGAHALIVTDPFMVQNGTAERVQARIAEAGVRSTVFDGVTPDPTDGDVASGLRALTECGADVVVGLGGGSSLDAAKMIAVCRSNPEPIREFMGYHRIPAAGLPLIAIPTTAGTGSEATRVTVITETATHTKMMILDGKLLPSVALVDFELTMTMPRGLTCHVGIDTLTHGIEAYVSTLAGKMTDPYALSCISLVGRFLERAWRNGEDREAREAMSIAACHGGLAFSNSSVCLVHGMSRPLGAVFGIPHGLSNAVLLPAVVRYSVAGAVGRYATVARTLGFAAVWDDDELASHKLVDGIDALNARLEVPRLRDLRGVTREALEASVEKMAEDALASGSPARNPVVPSVGEIEHLYRSAW